MKKIKILGFIVIVCVILGGFFSEYIEYGQATVKVAVKCFYCIFLGGSLFWFTLTAMNYVSGRSAIAPIVADVNATKTAWTPRDKVKQEDSFDVLDYDVFMQQVADAKKERETFEMGGIFKPSSPNTIEFILNKK
jgi:hypothetical protein